MTTPAPEPTPTPGRDAAQTDNPRHAMDLMLREQQVFVDRLFAAANRASKELLDGLAGKPARAALAQVSTLLNLGARLLDMQRKAYRVPERMEIAPICCHLCVESPKS